MTLARRHPADPPPTRSPREPGIDAARYLFCILVALLHLLPPDPPRPAGWLAIISACRLAVPFFFVASGWFLSVPDRLTGAAITRPLVRLGVPYAVWFAVYWGADALHTGRFASLGGTALLTGGPGFHLWFLPALAASQIAIVVGIRLAGRAATAGAAVLLAVAGLAAGTYGEVLGLPPVPATRLFAAPLFVVAGLLLRRRDVRPGWPAALAATVAAWLAVIGEEHLIARLSGAPLASHDIVVATVPLGIAAFLLVRALPAGRVLAALARLGPISLGVYAAHLLFVPRALVSIGNATLPRMVAGAAFVIAAATLLSLALARLPLGRRLVS